MPPIAFLKSYQSVLNVVLFFILYGTQRSTGLHTRVLRAHTGLIGFRASNVPSVLSLEFSLGLHGLMLLH